MSRQNMCYALLSTNDIYSENTPTNTVDLCIDIHHMHSFPSEHRPWLIYTQTSS